jgi:predicted esterase
VCSGDPRRVSNNLQPHLFRRHSRPFHEAWTLVESSADGYSRYSRSDSVGPIPIQATIHAIEGCSIPFLDEDDPEAYQWYPTYDDLGELLTNPNPSSILQSLVTFLELLIAECSWQSSRIHLFGFAQGGSVAIELALLWSRLKGTNLGSAITVAGPLLSYPTVSSSTTPVLVIHRPGSNESVLRPIDLSAIRKGFTGRVIEEKFSSKKEGMPAEKDEWEPLMRFWSEVLSRRAPEGTVEVSQ